MMARDDPSTLPGDNPFLAPACTATAMRSKLGSEFENKISYNAPMHFRHRQTDTECVASARDVYITSRAKMGVTD